VRRPGEAWQYKVKLSEEQIKISNPGIQQVRRYISQGEFIADVIYDAETGLAGECIMVDPLDATLRKRIPTDTEFEDLLVPVIREGKVVYQSPGLPEIRARTQAQLAKFQTGIKRFVNPHRYAVGLESG